MNTPYIRAPHKEGSSHPDHSSAPAPNAALLIDFDNVTMGMRSDLSKELKTLLSSDIIRGKVTVQRAYADWRRYPQYIVPLSEASIDLIFAPAYGSSKKNATDIRMAIDGMELVFTRPEIGTYILLTGDSDFSSLVLKLKEYGKYVIGVGIQESSSDILVQNCDEYYSYTSLSGLRKTADEGGSSDPWVLVEKAVERMSGRNDVMRSDRLKQVMLELDSGFDEGTFGFSKFSRFLAEASSRGLLRLKKLENGQYEIAPAKGGQDGKDQKDGSRSRGRSRESPRGRGSEGGRSRSGSPASSESRSPAPSRKSGGNGSAAASEAEGTDLEAAYTLLRKAIGELAEDHGGSVRDSDVKRRMLALESSFDETSLGFPKFSRFLRRAHDQEVVELKKGDDGNYQVSLGRASGKGLGEPKSPEPSDPGGREVAKGPEQKAPQQKAPEPKEDPAKKAASASPRLRPRTSVRRPGASKDEPPPVFEGQVVRRGGSGKAPASEPSPSSSPSQRESGAGSFDTQALRLPTGRDSMIQYLGNSYKGVGKKTAEALVDAFGAELFRVLHESPEKVESVVPSGRAEKVLEGWRADYQRRKARTESSDPSGPGGATGEPLAEEAEAAAASSSETSESGAPTSSRSSRRRTRPGSSKGRR